MFKTYDSIFPIEKHQYDCPICKRYYENYREAKNCIDSHARPTGLEGFSGFNQKQNCPQYTYVKLSDERIATYQLIHVSETAASTEAV